MGFEIILSLAAGALATFLRLIREEERLKPFWESLEKNERIVAIFKFLGIKLPQPQESYQERLQKLFSKFNEVSSEADEIVSELERHVKNKEVVVRQLEQKEHELTEQVRQIRSSPESVAIKNQELLEEILRLQDELRKSQLKEGKSSIWRDLILFALGVLIPYIITWVVANLATNSPASP
jgi:chromosome segregation ATPase